MNRFDRQERVKQIGPLGQAKINHATVMIVGLGATGSYAAEQLLRGGISQLILVDDDFVTLTNLQRQTLYTEQDVTEQAPKVIACRNHLLAIQTSAKIKSYESLLTEEIVQENDFDLLLDCTDNFEARMLINQLALKHQFDYIFSACAGTYGQVMLLSPTTNPCLGCVFPDLTALTKTDCDVIGVNTPLIPMVASYQVSLAFHYLVEPKGCNFTTLYTFDNWTLSQTKFQISKVDDCSFCQHPETYQLKDANTQLRQLCGEATYSIRLPKDTSIQLITEYLQKQQITFEQHHYFIHFTWHKLAFSLFSNGKLLIYEAHAKEQAEASYNGLLSAIHQKEVVS